MSFNVAVFEDESVDDLQFKGLKLIQKKEGFRFGLDAVLLSDFADIKRNDWVIDLGTGTGIIPILLAGKTEAAKIFGLEIQEQMCEISERSIALNGLCDRIGIIRGDIREFPQGEFSTFKGRFDVVVSNPPYMSKGGGLINESDEIAVSKHEILCSLEDVIVCAERLLAPGGQFAMIHRPARLSDIFCLMRKHNIEPKYMRLVFPAPDREPNLVLVRGLKNGRPFLRIMKPLFVYDVNGKYTDEIKNMYHIEE